MTSSTDVPLAPSPAARVRLDHVRILDVAHGRYLEPDVSLILHEGRIESLPGHEGQPTDRRADQAIDLGGRVAIPGLCSSHNHLQLVLPAHLLGLQDLWLAGRHGPRQVERNMADCLLHGVTLVRDAWSENLALNRRLREKIRRSEIPGPRIRQSVLVSQHGGTFAQRRHLGDRIIGRLAGIPLIPYENPASGVVAFPADASARMVREAVNRALDERGAECIKLYDQRERKITYEPGPTLMTQEQLDAAADQARRRGVPSTLHHVTVESFRRGVRAGVTSLVHVPTDGPLAPEDLRAFVAAGCILEPTLSLAYDLNWALPGCPQPDASRLGRLGQFREASYEGMVRRFWLPELQPSALAGLGKVKAGRTRVFGLLELGRVFRYFAGLCGPGMDNTRAVFAAGGKLACGNDAGALPRTPAMVGLELALIDFALREGGGRLSGADALRIATLHGALALGLADRFGSLEPGKTADIAILDRDPLTDPPVLGGPVAALFLGGRLAVNRCGLHSAPAS